MFRELMNFSYRRTALQAFGWYLTFLLIGVLIGAIAGAIFAAAGGIKSFSDVAGRGVWIGQVVIIPYHILLALALLWSRWRGVASIFLALAAILISVFLGALGGLIPLAVLTTRAPDKWRKEIAGVFE